jgi:hypothetical protein
LLEKYRYSIRYVKGLRKPSFGPEREEATVYSPQISKLDRRRLAVSTVYGTIPVSQRVRRRTLANVHGVHVSSLGGCMVNAKRLFTLSADDPELASGLREALVA